MRRRRALGWLGAAGIGGLGGLVGCGGGDLSGLVSSSGGGGTSGTTTTGSASGSCTVVPEETAGLAPADGSNSVDGSVVNALALSGIVHSDLRASIAGATGTAQGVALVVRLTLVNATGACANLAGYAVYLWHCDREGRYSMYSAGVTDQNYLRGAQETDSRGAVAFTTVFPGCYSGRMPHLHFEIYRRAATATSFANRMKTSQIALPRDVCQAVYSGAAGYGASVANLSRVTFASDSVFSDGVQTQLAVVTGSVAAGYEASIAVGISV